MWRIALEAKAALVLREAIDRRYRALSSILDDRLGLQTARHHDEPVSRASQPNLSGIPSRARFGQPIGFVRFLRAGVPITLMTTPGRSTARPRDDERRPGLRVVLLATGYLFLRYI